MPALARICHNKWFSRVFQMQLKHPKSHLDWMCDRHNMFFWLFIRFGLLRFLSRWHAIGWVNLHRAIINI